MARASRGCGALGGCPGITALAVVEPGGDAPADPSSWGHRVSTRSVCDSVAGLGYLFGYVMSRWLCYETHPSFMLFLLFFTIPGPISLYVLS